MILTSFKNQQMSIGEGIRDQSLIKISNGFKIFMEGGPFSKRETTVLQNFNINVPVGSLYSLLGSSGCGKTTVLSCIAGARKLTSGQVDVFGSDVDSYATSHVSHKIGYMPQESCLYQHLSIHETLVYFATLFGFQNKYLFERIGYVRKLLSLPPAVRIVGTLSGGQQRRVSLAITLLQEPEIFLLDEATSGADPLVRQLIWKHLKFLAATKGTTIILTTHYVEEAKDSDLVGIMRNGQMVAEGNPSKLMQTHGVNSMEALFLTLSKKQQENPTLVPSIRPSEAYSDYAPSHQRHFDRKGQNTIKRAKYGGNSLRRIRALADKNFKSMFRNFWMMLFILVDPAIIVYFICNTFRHEPYGISLGVVNDDIGRDAQCPNNYSMTPVCHTEHLSCVFLDTLPSEIFDLKSYSTIEHARQGVIEGNTYGFMHFSENFTSSLISRVLTPVTLFIGDDEFDSWNSSQITVRLDRTNTLIFATISSTLHETLETSSKNILRDCGYDERIAQYSLQYKEPILGTKGVSFRDFVAPSMTILVLYFFSSTVALRFIGEKRQGTLERSMASGAKIWEILIGYAISEFTLLILQTTLIFCVHFGFSLIVHPSNIPLILLQCILQGISGLTLGFLLAVVCNYEVEVVVATTAIVMSNLILSGMIWPREGMSVILQEISSIFPMTLPAEAMRSLMIRGWGIEHPNVWPGICVTVIYILGSAFLAALIFSRQLRK